MSSESEMRRIWRDQWLGCLAEIAALDWQKRWWGRINNPHYTFVECVSSYFDDLLTDWAYDYALAAGFVSDAEVSAVSPMHAAFDAYTSSRGSNWYDHEAITQDPAWAAVSVAAREARQTLLTLIDDADERRDLMLAEPNHP